MKHGEYLIAGKIFNHNTDILILTVIFNIVVIPGIAQLATALIKDNA